MKKFLVLLALLLTAPLFAAAPVFLGDTTDYITNSGGTITFVYSNRVRVVYGRGNSALWITNSISGNTLLITFGQGDVEGSNLIDYVFGSAGKTWEEFANTNLISLIEISSLNPIWEFDKKTDVLRFAGIGGIKVEASSVNFTNLPGTGSFVVISPNGLLYRTNSTGGVSGIATNANQFGASTTLTLKDGTRLTNAVLVNSLSAPSTNANGLAVTLQSRIISSNLTLFWPTNGFAGISDPVMIIDPASISGVDGNHTGQMSWASAASFGGTSQLWTNDNGILKVLPLDATFSGILITNIDGGIVFVQNEGGTISPGSQSILFGQIVTGTLSAQGSGSFAGGIAGDGEILADADAAFAFGYAANSGSLAANSSGSWVFGYIDDAGSITADAEGAGAFGWTGTGSILSDDVGALSFGWATGGSINSSGGGAMAFGYANQAGTVISATTYGALAFGDADINGSQITSSGAGALAHGYASGATIVANADGALGGGVASDGSIEVSGTAAFAHGFGPLVVSGYGAIGLGQNAYATEDFSFVINLDAFTSSTSSVPSSVLIRATNGVSITGGHGLRADGPTINFTNIPGTGPFVAIDAFGNLFRTNEIVDGEASATNATQIGLLAGVVTGTNRFKSVQSGFGILATNQTGGTNIVFAIDAAVVAQVGWANAISNLIFSTATNYVRTQSGLATNLTVNNLVSTVNTNLGAGGALTNFTVNLDGDNNLFLDGGTTNVNLRAMNWASGLAKTVNLVITNRTATVRTVSFDAITNNWLGMGTITGPISVTNALYLSIKSLGGTNMWYGAQYTALPTQ